MIDPNKILNALLREDLNEEKSFTLFFIWYDIHNSIRIAIECKDRKISLA
jgi:serine phosphatase RsbU (regulator of sigma subunit)